jgi:hypothetical protein
MPVRSARNLIAFCRKSGQMYHYIGKGRIASCSEGRTGTAGHEVVVCAQLEHTTFREKASYPPVELPPGTLQVFDRKDFDKRFLVY